MEINAQQHHFENVLQEGIRIAKLGEKEHARHLLNKAVEIKNTDARPWLWLAELAETRQEKRDYLESAVAAEPGNPQARRELGLFSGKIPSATVLAEGEGVHISHTETPLDSHSKNTYLCQKCGAALTYDIHADQLECKHCGTSIPVEHIPAADAAEQVLDFVLPTRQGHTWAENAQRYACAQCGAVSIWLPGQTTLACPYCGSGHLIESTETADMIEPHAIGLMHIDKKEAAEAAKTWLSKDWFVPDDLTETISDFNLRPAYYPFWTFDGTMEFKWSCQVNEGSKKNPIWVKQSGVDYEMYDDILIPAIRMLHPGEINKITPFFLKEVIRFKPAFLAGWTALTYSLSLSDGSLNAREQVVRRVKKEINQRIAPGKEKKDMVFIPKSWQDTTFKLVLLPLWLGNYRYKGQNYTLMINGQTGNITGEKPKDKINTTGIVLSAILTLILLFLLLILAGINFGWINTP